MQKKKSNYNHSKNRNGLAYHGKQMPGTAVTEQPPTLLRRANQFQATGDEEAAEEVVPEEAATKDVAERWMHQPPIINIINQELKGISGGFWCGFRDRV